MKRLLKSWVFWAFVIPGVLTFAAFVFHWESADLQCACASKNDRKRLFIGLGKNIYPLLTWESQTTSAFHMEVYSAGHAHQWASVNSAFLSLGGQGRISCGFIRAAPLAYAFEQEPRFRAWLKERIASGAIDRAEIDREMTRQDFYGVGKYPFGWTPP